MSAPVGRVRLLPSDRLRREGLSNSHVIVNRIADKQFGAVTRSQLIGAGLSRRQIEHLVRNGLLIRVHRGVFRTPGSTRTPEREAIAACLAIGSHAVVSHSV